jgi:hypothetical protein
LHQRSNSVSTAVERKHASVWYVIQCRCCAGSTLPNKVLSTSKVSRHTAYQLYTKHVQVHSSMRESCVFDCCKVVCVIVSVLQLMVAKSNVHTCLSLSAVIAVVDFLRSSSCLCRALSCSRNCVNVVIKSIVGAVHIYTAYMCMHVVSDTRWT